MALTAGFMCIIACDCNNSFLPGANLAYFAESEENTNILRDLVCSTVPWEEVDFAEGSAGVDMLAELAVPLMGACGCADS